jgi:hypothetical protein
MEIAMHELAVLPSGDLTAGGSKVKRGAQGPGVPLPPLTGAQHLATGGRK